MFNHSTDLFSQICLKVSNKLYFQQLITKQQKFFDIQPYKIDKLYSQCAKKLYKQICYKYQTTQELTPNSNFWHQNQRKIFIWFIVCYFYEIGVQDPFEFNPDWNLLSQIFFNKSSPFLKFQFLNIIKHKKRIVWSSQEDELLIKATDVEGIGKWNQISKSLFFNSEGVIFKTPKHCRQRWLNHLDGNKNKGNWGDEQDYKIFMFVRQKGKKWSKIVQILDNKRTQHMVKNRFNSLLTKNRRNKKQKQSQTVEKILKSLSKTLGVNQQGEEKVSAFRQKNQQFKKEQSVNQIEYQKQNSQSADINAAKIIEKRSSFQLSSFQTMSFFNNHNVFSKQMMQPCISIPEHENKSQQKKAFFIRTQNMLSFLKADGKQWFWSNYNQVKIIQSSIKDKQRLGYKIKPVLIIQKNF